MEAEHGRRKDGRSGNNKGNAGFSYCGNSMWISVYIYRKIRSKESLNIFQLVTMMSILNKMSNLFEIVAGNQKSTNTEIQKLLQYSKIKVPDEFLKIINENTELEILVNKEKYIRIWGANGCIEMNNAYHIQKYIPNSLAIGDDECGNAVLYANGNNGWGVYMV